MISVATRSTAPSTPPTVSAPLPRIETAWPSRLAVGTTTSVARRTSSLVSSGASAWVASSGAADTGTPPAELGAEVIDVARFGANEPAAGISAGRSADWSRSWNVESDVRRLSTTSERNSRCDSWCTW